jgi:hypothetical protein
VLAWRKRYVCTHLMCYRRSRKQDCEGSRIEKLLKTAFKRPKTITLTGLTFVLRVAYILLFLELESPPLPVGLPWKTPEGGSTVCGRCVAGGVSNCFSKFHTIFCWYTNTNRLNSGTVPHVYSQSHADQLATPREFRTRALCACRLGGVCLRSERSTPTVLVRPSELPGKEVRLPPVISSRQHTESDRLA